MVHGFSVDLEDFYPANFTHYDEIARNTRRILKILSTHNSTATFFCVGRLAPNIPDLLRNIINEGHELGVHGWNHDPVSDANIDRFRAEVSHAKEIIEQITGVNVNGYRAPFLSIDPHNRWMFDALAESGFTYDSSVRSCFIPNHLRGRSVFSWHNGLLEVPPTPGLYPFPLIGGGYFRHLPLWWSLLTFNYLQRSQCSVVFYTHTYEIEEDFPPISVWRSYFTRGLLYRLLQSRNRGDTHYHKLMVLLERYVFCCLIEMIKKYRYLGSIPAVQGGS